MRVAVVGAGGRMGQEVCEAVSADDELELVAQLESADSPDILIDSKAEVVVDFTQAESARQTLKRAAGAGINAVVGTTGFTENDIAELNSAFTKSACLIAPNFAIGAVLMTQFARMASPYFETAEVLEMHHEAKRDAPSGTAMDTVRQMAEASKSWDDDSTRNEVIPGSRGAEGPAGIRVHSIRLKGLVAHQEVILGTTGQSLTIRHDAYDRSAFMPGVILAIKRVSTLPTGVTVGLENILDGFGSPK